MYIQKFVEITQIKEHKNCCKNTRLVYTNLHSHLDTVKDQPARQPNLCVLKVGLIECYTSAEAAWGQLTVRGWELGGKHYITVGVDWANLAQHRRTLGHTFLKLGTVLVEGQQTHAVPVWRTDKTTVWAKAQLLDIAAAHVGLLDVVRESQRAAGRGWQPWRGSLLKLVHTRPLQEREAEGDHSLLFILITTYNIGKSCLIKNWHFISLLALNFTGKE